MRHINAVHSVFSAVAAVILLLLLFGGCGKRSLSFKLPGLFPAQNDSQADSQTGADRTTLEAQLMAELERQLAERLARGERFAAAVPTGESGTVTDLEYDAERGVLRWSYVNLGDYDFSQEVGISDITPIALNYLHDTDDGEGDDAVETWVDGSGNGEVGIEDITTVATNYLHFVSEYSVQAAADEAGPFSEVGRATFTDNTLEGQPIVLEFEFDSAAATRYVVVTPLDPDGAPGEMSNVVDTQSALHGPLEIVQSSISGATVVETEITRQFTVRNNTDAAIDWTLADDRDWVTLDSDVGTADPQSDTTITATLSAVGMAPGNYNGRITLTYADGIDICFVYMTVNASGAVANIVQTLLDFTAPEGGQDVLALTLRNDGNIDLDWTIAGDESWLSFIPASGTLAAGDSVPIDVTADAFTLTQGYYTGVVTVADSDDASDEDTCSAGFTVTPGIPPVLDHFTADGATGGAGTESDPWVFPAGTDRVQFHAWTSGDVEITDVAGMAFDFGATDPPGPGSGWSESQAGYLIWSDFDSVVEVTGQFNGEPIPPLGYWIYKPPF